MYNHLHVHTYYSLLDGLASPLELAKKAKELGQDALAMTDHGNMHGAVDFYKSCNEVGIKPIIGLEAYIAPQSRLYKESKKGDRTRYHVTLLAKNNVGYQNLMALSSISYLEGFYYRPRIDVESLIKYKEGIICLSGCIGSRLSRLLIDGKKDIAVEFIKTHRKIFGEDFYLEVMDMGLPEQEIVRQILPDIASDLNVPVIATNDVHYTDIQDSQAHDALLCIATATNIYNPKRLKFSSNDYYMKSRDEMLLNWPSEYLDTSIEIASKCNVTIGLGRRFHIYGEESAFRELKVLCDEKIEQYPEDYRRRYEYELSIIEKTAYSEYIMVVADYIQFAIKNNIPVGAGRGSSAGSLVCYLLGITNIDPIRYGLIFERFINADRVEPPDIDVDVCQSRRGEVIEYLRNKYGEDKVAQIMSFGTLKTKAVIKDVCRIMQLPFGLGDTICKTIPEPWEDNVEDAIKIPAINQLLQSVLAKPQYDYFCDVAKKIEGRLRHGSTHAAGIVISDRPLTEVTPLYKKPSSTDILTQYDMNAIGALGLLKFDVLGLRTLTVIDEASKAANIKITDIDLEDSYTYSQLRSGSTMGVFQYEGWGYTKFLKRMKPKCFDDLVALGALYRPGPLNSGMADDYIYRKDGQTSGAKWENEFPGITDDTYGIMLYQEQIMQVANRVAGFTMNEADTLRKAIGKKDKDLMDKMLARISDKELCNKITTFARYGWNKAHAVSYALLSYQTAYLKANHPVEYFCAILNSEIKDGKRMTILMQDAQKCEVFIEPPHINLSDRMFTIHSNRLYAGLQAIKGIGENSCKAILAERQKNGNYKDQDDLRLRIPPKLVNSVAFTALVEAGVFRETNDSVTLFNVDMTSGSEFDVYQLRELCKQHKGEVLLRIVTNTTTETAIPVDGSPRLKRKIKELGGILC